MNKPSEDKCSLCIHHMSCYARTTLINTIQSFKLLAMDVNEAKNTNCSKSAEDLLRVLGSACTAWLSKEDESWFIKKDDQSAKVVTATQVVRDYEKAPKKGASS